MKPLLTLALSLGLLLYPTARAAAATFDLETASVQDIQAAVDAGALTYERLVQLYQARIQAYDKQGPGLNAVITLNPQALETARALDREFRQQGRRSPLHGIPILAKDNYDTADMPTSGGSFVLAKSVPYQDAPTIRQLRQAGAIILAKVNMDEFAHGGVGFSSRLGQTRNPHDPRRIPNGSSGGTGAGLAAWYAPLGLGSDTGGSIRGPSFANGVVGIKPTVGLVSRRGVIPISHSQDTAGPIARTVADAAMLLNVLAAPDPDDPACVGDPDHVDHGARYPRRPEGLVADGIDYPAGLDADGLRGARIGVLRTNREPHFAGAVLGPILARMRDAGATVIDPVCLAQPLGSWNSGQESVVLLHEFKVDIAQYLAAFAPEGPMRTLADLIAFNEGDAARELRWFGQ
ncbi:amidase family protein, partial [Pseudoxanthomonas winnipegensis]|uniref:amidase family protein n=1 Tax=Pseudoxanthomonas winnipegensis TaxID=2480810 RepID=UPI003F857475